MTERLFFDIFNKLDENKYDSVFSRVTVSNVKIQREKRILIGELHFNEFVPYKIISNTLAEMTQIYQLSELSLNIVFDGIEFTEDMWPSVVQYLCENNCNTNGFFKDSTVKIEGNNITVNLLHGGLSMIRSFKLDDDIAKVLKQWFSKRYELNFIGRTEATDNQNEISDLPLPEAPPPVVQYKAPPAPAPKPAPVRRKPAPVDPSKTFTGKLPFDISGGQIIKGKKIGNTFIKLCELSRDASGRVTVMGEIFFADFKLFQD